MGRARAAGSEWNPSLGLNLNCLLPRPGQVSVQSVTVQFYSIKLALTVLKQQGPGHCSGSESCVALRRSCHWLPVPWGSKGPVTASSLPVSCLSHGPGKQCPCTGKTESSLSWPNPARACQEQGAQASSMIICCL
jgi:hypothetical protein